jgi:CRP-like cAMP-binding protein
VKKPSTPDRNLGPALRAIPFVQTGAGKKARLLTDRQRAQLAGIGTRLRLPAGTVIYRKDSAAAWLFAVSEGVVKSYRELPSGKRIVNAFLFPDDLFGLAENGRYLNSAQAVTEVIVYQLPLDRLLALVKRDAKLQFPFLVKVTHELRESHRRMILRGRRHATGRVAMFLMLMQKHLHTPAGREREIRLPMTRSDIADFLGLSRESMSRAAAQLERRGIVRFENRHLARILNAGQLARLAAAV